MRKKFFRASVCMVLIIFFSACPFLSVRLNTPLAPIKERVDNRSISISWTAIDGARGYDVYVGTENKADGDTTKKSNMFLIEKTDYVIKDLTPNTQYYIWLKAVNYRNDSAFSPELKITTKLEVIELNSLKEFHAFQYVLDQSKPKNITFTAKCVKSTENLYVYLREDQEMLEEKIDYLTENFEKQYKTMTSTYGTHTDIDGNEKIIILLYDISEKIDPNSGYVAGLFWSGDLYSDDDIASSNEAEILYVESQVPKDMENIFGTVIHEFQHLINFNMNVNMGEGESDLWLNEALSESAVILVSGGISGGRVDVYNHFLYNSVIKEGNYFYYWNTYNTIIDYATASLFMYWLYLNGEGRSILQNIAQASPHNRGDYNSVIEAIGKTADDSSLKTLSSWEAVLSTWLEANENYQTGYPGGKWTASKGRSGPLKLDSKVYSGTADSIELFPGDAILTRDATTNATTGAGDNIFRLNFTSTRPGSGSINITLNRDTRLTANPMAVNLSVATAPVTTRTARMSVAPALVDGDYRIIHVPQRPLPAGVYE